MNFDEKPNCTFYRMNTCKGKGDPQCFCYRKIAKAFNAGAANKDMSKDGEQYVMDLLKKEK